MPKSISASLLAHKSSPGSTLCYLLHIGPLSDGTYIGVTSLDQNVTYNPHDYDTTAPNVSQVFYSSAGIDVSNLAAANDLTVNNGEGTTLGALYPAQGVSEDDVKAGALDGVTFTIYLVNYRDLTMGHEILSSGPIGECRIMRGGAIIIELRSWSDLLRQNSVCELDSLTCRVKHFGSQVGEERFPCMYDLTSEWVTGVAVTALGSEHTREFVASSLAQAADYFAPGVVRWVTGNNAGRTQEIDTFDTGGAIALQFSAREDIQIGDTFDIRRDCSREWSGHNSCDTFNNRAYFRGEPFIPVAAQASLTVPGAGIGGFQG